jgi:hypothetical protein
MSAETFEDFKRKLPGTIERITKAHPSFKAKILPGLNIVKYENFDYYITLNVVDGCSRRGKLSRYVQALPPKSDLYVVTAYLVYCVLRGKDELFERVCTRNLPVSTGRFLRGEYTKQKYYYNFTT